MKLIKLFIFLIFYSLIASPSVFSEDHKIVISKDVHLSIHHKELKWMMGSNSKFKLKCYEELYLFDFDLSKFKGQEIKEAYLYIKPAGGNTLGGINGGTDMKYVSLSTVSSQWDEKKACGANSGLDSYWGWPGGDITDVVLGNGKTLRKEASLVPVNGYLKIKIDLDLIGAIISGTTDGLALVDGTTNVGFNCSFWTREQKKSAPFIIIKTGGKVSSKVHVANDLLARSFSGGIELSFKKKSFSYDILMNGKKLERWRIPFYQSSFKVHDLLPNQTYEFIVEKIDHNGFRSKSMMTSVKTNSSIVIPQIPNRKVFVGNHQQIENLEIFVFPELTKLNPTNANSLGGDIKNSNSIWNGSQIMLDAARGEIISFQVGIKGMFTEMSVEIDEIVKNNRINFYKNYYVKEHSEYAIPFKKTFSNTKSSYQAITVDIHIPVEAKPGKYLSKVHFSYKGKKLSLPLKIKIFNVMIPEDIHFNVELNCYGGVGEAGSDQFKQSYRLAHYHRATINRVPYSQNGGYRKEWAPLVKNGKIIDWKDYDKNIGPLLDGSLFKNSPRKGVPVASFYLPFFEGYPLSYRDYYKGKQIPFKSIKGQRESKIKNYVVQRYHYDDVPEKAIGREYQIKFINAVRDFYQHAKDKKWNRSMMQLYLNNKPNRGFSLWTLDEPTIYKDWEAINFFGKLFKKGIDDPEVYTKKWHDDLFKKGLKRDRPTFLFRGDISRPNFQGTLSDDIINIMYVGGGSMNRKKMMRNHKNRMPSIISYYGSCNKFEENHWNNVVWVYKSYALEGDGVLPWQTMGEGFLEPDKMGNTLITWDDGKAYASFRLHALRRGAQDAELFRLLQIKNGWSRSRISELINKFVPLKTEFKQAFSDEAAAAKFKKVDDFNFIELKRFVLNLLEE